MLTPGAADVRPVVPGVVVPGVVGTVGGADPSVTPWYGSGATTPLVLRHLPDFDYFQ